jgi:hypothetical protein
MAYPMTPAQREHVTSLTAAERHFHFIDKVVENQAIWTLKKGEELLLFSDENGKMSIPVWPHPDYAQQLAPSTWRNATVVRIDLDSFLNRTLPSCVKDDVHFLVFPVSDKKGSVVAAENLQQELSDALENVKDKKPRTLDDLPTLPDDFIAQL